MWLPTYDTRTHEWVRVGRECVTCLHTCTCPCTCLCVYVHAYAHAHTHAFANALTRVFACPCTHRRLWMESPGLGRRIIEVSCRRHRRSLHRACYHRCPRLCTIYCSLRCSDGSLELLQLRRMLCLLFFQLAYSCPQCFCLADLRLKRHSALSALRFQLVPLLPQRFALFMQLLRNVLAIDRKITY